MREERKCREMSKEGGRCGAGDDENREVHACEREEMGKSVVKLRVEEEAMGEMRRKKEKRKRAV